MTRAIQRPIGEDIYSRSLIIRSALFVEIAIGSISKIAIFPFFEHQHIVGIIRIKRILAQAILIGCNSRNKVDRITIPCPLIFINRYFHSTLGLATHSIKDIQTGLLRHMGTIYKCQIGNGK